jgi:hypothetical protein
MMHMTRIMLEGAIPFVRSVKHECREWRETVDRLKKAWREDGEPSPPCGSRPGYRCASTEE